MSSSPALTIEWLVKFLEHRIADRRVLRLIQKWMAAGVIENGDVDGDVWRAFRKGHRHRRCSRTSTCTTSLTCGPTSGGVGTRAAMLIIVRFADDSVVGFEYREDAERFWADLRDRLAEFRLELNAEKTRLIEFGRFAAERREKRGLGQA